MAELFIDIRDRQIRAIVSESEIVRLQKTYPLKPAEDACILDTSTLDISGVVVRIYQLLQERAQLG